MAASLSLAIGMAAITTTFSWVDQMLLRPLPGVRDSGGLFVLMSRSASGAPGSISYPDYLDLRTGLAGVADVAATAFLPLTFSIGRREPAESVFVEFVSDNYFDTLGARIARGRAFQGNEAAVPGSLPVAVLSHAFWQQRFGGDPAVLGRNLLLNNQEITIVGVTSPEFQGGFVATETNMWLPLVIQNQLTRGDFLTDRARRWLQGLVRVRSDGGSAQLRTRVDAASRRLANDYASIQQGRTFFVTRLWQSPAGVQVALRPVLFGLTGLATLLLLLACANVANLLLARALQRRREVAIRLALGAGRGRAVAPFLAEAAVLAWVGGASGFILTIWAVRLLRVFQPPVSFTMDFGVEIDRVGLLVLSLVVVLAAGLVGLAPAIHTLRAAPIAVLRSESESLTVGRGRRHLSDLLTVVQIAMCLAVLVGTGLSLQSFRRAQQIPLGFNADNMLLASYDVVPERYSEDAGMAFHEQFLERITAIPGVSSASIAATVPFGMAGQIVVPIEVEGFASRPGEDMQVNWNAVGPAYFRTMAVSLLRGREFSARDRKPSPKVAIVSDAMARRYWPNTDALGRRVSFRGAMYEVVGVVADMRYNTLRDDPPLVLYMPALQWYRSGMTLHVRTGAPAGTLPHIRRALNDLDPSVPLFDTSTLRTRIQASTFVQRFAASLGMALVIPSLVLTAVGLFSLLAHAIAERTAEIALRVALGAQRADVAWMILRHALLVTLGGLGLGVAAGSVMAALLSRTLIGVDTTDTATWTGALLTVVGIAAAASALATLRAVRIGPLLGFGRTAQV